jgi:AraC family transcriptional regulator of adaptative response / DNA-3-methyladenine glycosylase II
LRVPGAADAHELAIRAVLGQQVSLAAARTLAGRLVTGLGEALAEGMAVNGVSRLFPSAAAVAAVDRSVLAMPQARARALQTLCGALAGGRLSLSGDRVATREALLALPGIGPWTADYVALRALRDPDAFLPGDLGVRRALEGLGEAGDPRSAAAIAERWRPHRSFAMEHLWATLRAEAGRPVQVAA